MARKDEKFAIKSEPIRCERVAQPNVCWKSEMGKSSFGAIFAISFGVCLMLVQTQSFTNERCQQLQALRVQYAGVELTSDQKQMKVKLVAWYNSHCRAHPLAGVN
jgi:hypothetical protein